MGKLEALTIAADWMERVNLVTMFVLPVGTAIYAIWTGDWRPFQSATVLGVAVLVFGFCVYTAKERAEKSAQR